MIKQMCKYVILFILVFTSLMQTSSAGKSVISNWTVNVYDDQTIPSKNVDEVKYVSRNKVNRQTIINLFILKFSLTFETKFMFVLLFLGVVANRNFYMDFRKKIRKIGIMHFHGSKYKVCYIPAK